MSRISASFFLVLALSLALPATAKDKDKSKPAASPATASRADKWAEKTLHKMTVEEKIGQLFMIWCRASFLNVENPEYLQWRDDMQKYHVGSFAMTVHVDGPFLLRSEPYEAAELLNRLQKESKLPLLIAADFERGLSMRLIGTAVFPHAMAFGADGKMEDAEKFGLISAQEARAIGVHWNFFPDADVNSNPANPIINTRSFGEDPKQVGDLASAYIKGAHAAGMMTTVKHFPGHGDTATDSHLGVASVNVDRTHLDTIELPPFRAAIAAGVDSVMVAHVTVPALDSDPNHVATISPDVVSDLLEKQLGFKGIIVTDALEMGGIAKGYSAGEAAVLALEAGADVLLMPADAEAAIDGVAAAVRTGHIKPARIDESVMRILTAKAHVGLATKRLVDLEEIHSVVNSTESNAAAQQISDRSVTLVRNTGDVIPLKAPATTAFFILAEGRTSVEGDAFGAEVRKRSAAASVILVDPTMSDADLNAAVQRASSATQYVVAAFASVAAYRGSVALGGGFPALVQNLVATKKPVALISLGNPYLLRSFPDVSAYMTTYSPVPPSEVSAVRALFGEIAIGGKLPVTIPGLAQYGDGIAVPASHPVNTSASAAAQ